MTKAIHDDVFDAAFTEISGNATTMTVCSTAPTTRTEAITTYALADVAVSSGDFTPADGDTSGRKVTVAAKSSVTVDADGAPTHVAIVDGTRLLLVTSCTGPSLTTGSAVNFPAFDFEINDPT